MPEKGRNTASVKRSKRKARSPEELHELELAGGEEGGMPAGSAGGPGEKDVRRERKVSNQV